MNTTETLRLLNTIQEAADAIAQLAIKQPVAFAALGLRHPLIDELSGYAAMLRESAAKEMSSDDFRALQQEGEGLERDIAMGHNSVAGDARMAQITRLMELSPWALHPDYGCILKKDLALADAIQATERAKSNQAEKAFSDYDFGDGIIVNGTDGWEYISPGYERTRAVYIETVAEDDGPAPSWKLTFTVRFDPATGTLAEAYAIDHKGQIWGSLPSTPSLSAAEMQVTTTHPDLNADDVNAKAAEQNRLESLLALGFKDEACYQDHQRVMQASLEQAEQIKAASIAAGSTAWEPQGAALVQPAGSMSTFEVVGFGFDGETDETDDRVLWVNASSRDEVLRAITGTKATCHGVAPLQAYIDFRLPGQEGELRAKLLEFAADEEPGEADMAPQP